MEKRPGIDFSRFKSLHTLVCKWNKKDSGLSQSSIKRLYLWHFNPQSKVFDGIAIPQSVERLELTWLNPLTLEGLPVMNNLSGLQIHRGRNLADITSLMSIAPNLKKLIVSTCSRLKGCEEVADHPTLELAVIDGRPLAFKTESNTTVAIQCPDKYSPIMNDWQNCPAVERDPQRVSGAWIFRGTRVPVRALFENLEDGATVDDFLEWFPGVQRSQVEAVLKHAERRLLTAA